MIIESDKNNHKPKPHKIAKYSSTLKKTQGAGLPGVWEDIGYSYSFNKLITKLFRDTQKYTKNLNDVLFKIKKYVNAVKNFQLPFLENFKQYILDLDIQARKKLVKSEPYYRLDYIDMYLLILAIRFKNWENKDAFQENEDNVFLAPPYVFKNPEDIEGCLTNDLEKLKQKNWVPNKFLFTFYYQNHWRCLRVVISEESAEKTIDIIFDDPYGHYPKSSNKEKSKKMHSWNEELVNALLPVIADKLEKFSNEKNNNKKVNKKDKNVIVRYKEHEQQNYFDNDYSSGFIVINNLMAYTHVEFRTSKKNKSKERRVSNSNKKNSTFVKESKKIKAEKILAEKNIKVHDLLEDVKIEIEGGKKEIYREFDDCISKVKKLYEKSNLEEFFEDVNVENLEPQKIFLNLFIEYLGSMLNRVPKMHRCYPYEYFKENAKNDAYLIPKWISIALSATHVERKSRISSDDAFKETAILNASGIKNKSRPPKSKKNKINLDQANIEEKNTDLLSGIWLVDQNQMQIRNIHIERREIAHTINNKDRYYTVDVINLLLSDLQQDNNLIKVYSGIPIEQVLEYSDQIIEQEQDYAFIPLNVAYDQNEPQRKNHWAAFIIDKERQLMFYLDPAKKPLPLQINDLNDSLGYQSIAILNPINFQENEQRDGWIRHCGAYVIEMFKKFSQSIQNGSVISGSSVSDANIAEESISLQTVFSDIPSGAANNIKSIREAHANRICEILNEFFQQPQIIKDDNEANNVVRDDLFSLDADEDGMDVEASEVFEKNTNNVEEKFEEKTTNDSNSEEDNNNVFARTYVIARNYKGAGGLFSDRQNQVQRQAFLNNQKETKETNENKGLHKN